MKKPFYKLVVDQWTYLPAAETADLTGKTVVVVGANTGIGFEAAKHFARMNPAKLVLACRSEDKGKSAVSDIRSATGYASCETWTVDLAEFSSVTRFAQRFERECDRLDILVMNAGILADEYQETVDGWELSLQVNHLSTALVSLLLVPRLVDTGKTFGSTSRLVIVSSAVHYWVALPENVKQSSQPVAKLSGPGYRDPSVMRGRYLVTKLLNVLFVRALQDRLRPTAPLTVNAANPGLCYSQLRRNMHTSVVMSIREMLLARTSEQGSRQLVYAAVGGREDDMKGAYVNNSAVDEPSDFVISQEGKKMQDALWRETIEILEKKAPRVTLIVKEYLA